MSDEEPDAPTLDDHVALLDQQLKQRFSWYVVAKKEFQDAIRSKGLWVLAFVFTALFVVPAAALVFGFVQYQTPQGQAVTDVPMADVISQFYLDTATLLIPIVSMFVGFGAITKERESGSLKIMLSLPHSREDVVVGKVVGRMAVLGVALAFGFLITALFFAAPKGFFAPALNVTFDASVYGLFALYTMGLALVFVAIAVSISGAVSRGLYSIIGNFFVYFYFTFGWNAIANAVADGLQNYLGVSGSLRWHLVLFIKLLNPNQAYKTLTNSMLGSGETPVLSARYGMFSQQGQSSESLRVVCADVLNGNATSVEFFGTTYVQCGDAGASVPFYFSDPSVFVYLLLWIGVAAFLSYRTFNLADL